MKGTCHCGSCMCNNDDHKGLVTGPFCECDDSECLDEETGEVCGGTVSAKAPIWTNIVMFISLQYNTKVVI